MLNVLIACEESQAVCKEFRRLGHRAFSCDIQECSGGHPEWHIPGDVIPLLNGGCTFQTADTHTHTQCSQWDMIIAFPPCTYLTTAGAIRLFTKDHVIRDYSRLEKGKEAARFFMSFVNADCDRISIENPTPMKIFELPRYDQVIQPYEFGHPFKKRTCLWLKNLPKLQPTDIVEPTWYWIGAHGPDKAKYGMSKGFRNPRIRSKTFPGIARAMAEQWSEYLEKENNQ